MTDSSSAETPDRDRFNAEMQRTAYQRKAVSRLSSKDVLDLAITFFTERGYRAARASRPNQVFVMGRAEGILPRVTGEVAARADVGKPGVTLVTLDAVGEALGPAMKDFYTALRARRSADAGAAGPGKTTEP